MLLSSGIYSGRCFIALSMALLTAPLLAAQNKTSAPVQPKDTVAVENTNASFSPSDETTPQASPARPTVTAPAHIPPTGYLQFEQGFNQANGAPSGTQSQFALSQTTKIALTTRVLVQLITEPYTYNGVTGVSGSTNESNDPGDLDLGAQYIVRKSTGAAPVIALGYLHRVRAGTSANLDVGSYSQSALLLLSGDVPRGFHYDANVIVNEHSSPPVRRAQFVQSLAVSHTLFWNETKGRLGGVIELSHFTQPLVSDSAAGNPVARANTAGLLFATTFSIRPNLILDAAFDHGLTSTSTQWQGSFGFTYLLPHRLWHDEHPVPIAVGPYSYRNTR